MASFLEFDRGVTILLLDPVSSLKEACVIIFNFLWHFADAQTHFSAILTEKIAIEKVQKWYYTALEFRTRRYQANQEQAKHALTAVLIIQLAPS